MYSASGGGFRILQLQEVSYLSNAHDNSSSSNIVAEHVAHDNSNSSRTYTRDLSTTGQFTTVSLNLQN